MNTRSTTFETQKVGEIVAANFQTARVFTKHGIDFCCNGGISLAAACLKNGIEQDAIIEQLKQAIALPDDLQIDRISLTDLIRRIVTVHHAYVQASLPALSYYLDKLCKVHGDRHPELHEIRSVFGRIAQALPQHMQKEEKVLFPYIQAMEQANTNEQSLSLPHFGHIDNPIAQMEVEHNNEGENLKLIAQLTNQYTCPPDGCQTFKVTYAMLQEFEQDLHLHIHLENNVLFPKAKQLYKVVIEDQSN